MTKLEKIEKELSTQVIHPITLNRMKLSDLINMEIDNLMNLIIGYYPEMKLDEKSRTHKIVEVDTNFILVFPEFQYKVDKLIFEMIRYKYTVPLIRYRI